MTLLRVLHILGKRLQLSLRLVLFIFKKTALEIFRFHRKLGQNYQIPSPNRKALSSQQDALMP